MSINSEFSFSQVTLNEMMMEINNLDTKKSGTYMNIPTKIMKESKEVVAEPLMHIWNIEIIENEKFPNKLKLADI